MSGEGGGGFNPFENPMHLLGLIIVLFLIWLATGGNKRADDQNKFVQPYDGQSLNTYDKRLPPDQTEKDFYRGYFE